MICAARPPKTYTALFIGGPLDGQMRDFQDRLRPWFIALSPPPRPFVAFEPEASYCREFRTVEYRLERLGGERVLLPVYVCEGMSLDEALVLMWANYRGAKTETLEQRA